MKQLLKCRPAVVTFLLFVLVSIAVLSVTITRNAHPDNVARDLRNAGASDIAKVVRDSIASTYSGGSISISNRYDSTAYAKLSGYNFYFKPNRPPKTVETAAFVIKTTEPSQTNGIRNIVLREAKRGNLTVNPSMPVLEFVHDGTELQSITIFSKTTVCLLSTPTPGRSGSFIDFACTPISYYRSQLGEFPSLHESYIQARPEYASSNNTGTALWYSFPDGEQSLNRTLGRSSASSAVVSIHVEGGKNVDSDYYYAFFYKKDATWVLLMDKQKTRYLPCDYQYTDNYIREQFLGTECKPGT